MDKEEKVASRQISKFLTFTIKHYIIIVTILSYNYTTLYDSKVIIVKYWGCLFVYFYFCLTLFYFILF